MNLFSEKDLIELNRQGIVPGPDEEETDFYARAEYCLNLRSHLEKELGKELPFSAASAKASDCFPRCLEKTKTLYDIVPEWIPVYFSDYKLNFWHGGCAWIFQEKENLPKGALMQLRQRYRESDSYLGIYRKDELAAHELAHVGRMCFEEPKFEEMLAYRSSKSAFRRWFGSIVQSPFESILFVLVLVMMVLIDLSLVTLGHYEFYRWAMWFKLVPLGMIVAALCRLWIRHRQFEGCFANLKKISSNPDGIIYRLTDPEIITFSKQHPDQIRNYIQNQSSVRWRVITAEYIAEAL